MPGDPKECRENAKRCLEFAQAARTEADRERFAGLFQRWLALATDSEAANVLLRNWSSGPITFSGHPVPPEPINGRASSPTLISARQGEFAGPK
jgi:hypothetical protein